MNVIKFWIKDFPVLLASAIQIIIIVLVWLDYLEKIRTVIILSGGFLCIFVPYIYVKIHELTLNIEGKTKIALSHLKIVKRVILTDWKNRFSLTDRDVKNLEKKGFIYTRRENGKKTVFPKWKTQLFL